ncbi:MAG: hypothetical protein JW836_11920 [Deltaproteobacteria bacterium]|nr:hypothetical protein [Deltaproteobacteria bacterium]
MRRAIVKSTAFCGLVGIISLGLFVGCATYKPSGPVNVPSGKIIYEVVKEADIESLTARLAKYAGWQNREVWHFDIALKNPTDKPQRYRVRVLLPDQGVSGGGLLPLKGTPPALAPGKEVKATYPVNYDKPLTNVLVVVETVSFE